MKNIYTFLTFIILGVFSGFSQSENFESLVDDQFEFTNNSILFTTGMDNFNAETGFPGLGASGSNVFVDNSNSTTAGEVNSLKSVNGENFTIKDIDIFLSVDAATSVGGGGTGNTLIIRGKEASITQFTITIPNSQIPTNFTPDNGFFNVNFATQGGTDNSLTNIDEIEFDMEGTFNYIAIDEFNFGDPVAAPDTSPAVVQSIVRPGNPNTTDDTVDFIVTFNEDATNVTTDDFALDVTGNAMGVISAISGSGASYTVSANMISGEGTLSIDLNANTDILDTTGNGNGTNGNTPAFTNGENHTVSSCFLESFEGTNIDDTTFSSNGVAFTTSGGLDIEIITGSGASSSDKFLSNDGAGSGTYSITSNSNFTIKTLDVYLSSIMAGTSPTNDGSITINGKLSGATVYTITKNSDFPTSTMNGDNGFSNINFATEGAADYSTTNIDELEIALGASFVYLAIDHFEFCEAGVTDTEAPDVTSIAVSGSPSTLAESVDFTVTFDENVSNVTTDDFDIDVTGTATGTISNVTGANNVYTITVNTISGEGTISIDLKSGTDIQDALMNNGTPAFTTGGTHTVSECFVETFESFSAGATSFTSNDLNFTATTGLDIFNLSMAGANNSDQLLDNEGNGSGTYSVSTTGGELFSANSIYVYVSSVAAATNPTDDGTLTIRGKRSNTEEFSVTLDNMNTTFPTSTANGTNGFLQIDFSSVVGNDFSTELIDELEFEIGTSFVYLGLDNFEFCKDETAPTVTITSSETSPSSLTTIPFTVTFSEDVTGFEQSDLNVSILGGGGTGSFTAVSASEYTFTVSPSGRLNAPITINIAANVAQDAAGNGNDAATEFSIETIAPALHNEIVNGDLSSNAAAPTPITFATGSNRIIGSVTSNTTNTDTRDYITFTVPTGFELTQILQQNYDDPNTAPANNGNRGFTAIDEGATTFEPGTGMPEDYLGGIFADPRIPGTDILPLYAAGTTAGSGFTSPLTAGTYTFVIQQTGPQISEYTLDFIITADVVAPTGYSVVIDQDPINSGNDNTTSFTFSDAEIGADFSASFSSDAGGTPVNVTGTVTATSQQITNIDLSGLSDGTITLSLTLTDAANNSGTAATDTAIKDEATLSIVDNIFSKENFFYTNPVNDLFSTKSSFTISDIKIYNLNGGLVVSSNGNTANTSELSSGVYLAIIRTIDGQTTTIKIVKK